jgi:hypothetical protein
MEWCKWWGQWCKVKIRGWRIFWQVSARIIRQPEVIEGEWWRRRCVVILSAGKDGRLSQNLAAFINVRQRNV